MGELRIVLLPLLALAGFALLASYATLTGLAGASLALIALGFLAGVPSGLAYHVLLRRALLHRGALPRGWYWAPQRYHADVDPARLRAMRPWFVVGALGFALIVLGFLLAIATFLLWLRAQRDLQGAGVG